MRGRYARPGGFGAATIDRFANLKPFCITWLIFLHHVVNLFAPRGYLTHVVIYSSRCSFAGSSFVTDEPVNFNDGILQRRPANGGKAIDDSITWTDTSSAHLDCPYD